MSNVDELLINNIIFLLRNFLLIKSSLKRFTTNRQNFSEKLCHFHFRLPDDVRLYPSIGNGHLGMVVHGNRIHMNGLYNGHTTHSHRAAIPSTCHVTFAGTLPTSSYHSQFTLDVSTGTFKSIFKSPVVLLYFIILSTMV